MPAWAFARRAYHAGDGPTPSICGVVARRRAARAGRGLRPGPQPARPAYCIPVDPRTPARRGRHRRRLDRRDSATGRRRPVGPRSGCAPTSWTASSCHRVPGWPGGSCRPGRPQWVADYSVGAGLVRPFSAEAEREGVKGMIAVPLVRRSPLGVSTAPTAPRRATAMWPSGRSRSRPPERPTPPSSPSARHSAEVAVHEERRRLALQLHDTVGAMLFTIGAGVHKLSDELDHQPDLRAQLEAIERQAAEAAAVFASRSRRCCPPDSMALAVAAARRPLLRGAQRHPDPVAGARRPAPAAQLTYRRPRRRGPGGVAQRREARGPPPCW